MTIEEVQALLLAEQEKTKELTTKVEEYKGTLATKETEFTTLKTDLENARELNSKLTLKIATQTLTPKEEPKTQQEEKKVLSFDEILKQL